MKEQSWASIDKSGWGEGPWQTEPDKKQWRDPKTGMPCLMVRNASGALCGYVGVTEEHSLFNKSYNSAFACINVHGGLTFSAGCDEGASPEHSICHIDPDNPGPVWWFGFDCAHSGDAGPALAAIPGMRRYDTYSTYRDLAFVTDECASLAQQLQQIG